MKKHELMAILFWFAMTFLAGIMLMQSGKSQTALSVQIGILAGTVLSGIFGILYLSNKARNR